MLTSHPTSYKNVYAVAKDQANVHMGDVINNYFGISQQDQYERYWLEIIEWLIPSKSATELQTLIFKESQRKYDPKTGLWFIDEDPLHLWLSGKEPHRWLSGSMGCGKTILFTAAIEATRKVCRAGQNMHFGHFYCSSRDDSGQDLEVLLRLLLVQLTPPSRIPGPVRILFDRCKDVYPPKDVTYGELRDCLTQVIRSYADTTAVYILLDGLDEIPLQYRSDLFDILRTLSEQQQPHLRVLVTSRGHADIRQALNESSGWDEVVAEEHLVQSDIEHYVCGTIESDYRLKSLDSNLKEAIFRRLAEDSGSMFLWASISLETLKRIRLLTQARIRTFLETLPSNITDTYLKILREIEPYFVVQASRALEWLVFCSRQLFVEELAAASSFDNTQENELEECLAPSEICELLGDLVTVQPPLPPNGEKLQLRRHTVVLAHASVTEFLLKELPSRANQNLGQAGQFHLERNISNAHIAQSCLAYLFRFNNYGERKADRPLRHYAWYNWDKHIPIQGSDECPLRESQIVRQRALQLYRALENLLSGQAESSMSEEGCSSNAMNAVLKNIGWLPDMSSLSRLIEALNVPFFHKNFDKMYATGYPCGDNSSMYVYEPTEPWSDTSIRLLELLPSLDERSDIRGILKQTTLQLTSPYVVLSHVWLNQGQLKNYAGKRILVDGRPMRVWSNLFRILRLLRSRAGESQPAIWVDAICINHQDIEERALQIQISGNILSNARGLLVGLNDPNGTAERGVEVLKTIAALAGADRNCEQEYGQAISKTIALMEDTNTWDAMLDLFEDAWWQRLWIIQEVVRASDTILLAGSVSFHFKAVEDAMSVEGLLRDKISKSNSRHAHRFFNHPGWNAARAIWLTRCEWKLNKPSSLPVLFYRFRNHRCSVPQDRIFALMAISDPQNRPKAGIIDYSCTAVETYKIFLRWWVRRYQNLNFLCLSIPFEPQHMNPSTQFEPVLINAPLWYTQMFNNKDVSAASESRPLSSGSFEVPRASNVYNACGTDSKPQTFSETSMHQHDLLGFWGAPVDIVEKVIPITETDLETYHTMADLSLTAQSAYLDNQPLSFEMSYTMKYWRTLFVDQWPVNKRISAFHGIRGMKLPTFAGEEADFLRALQIPDDVPFLKGRSIAVTWGRKMGLVPQQTRNNDHIVLLPGGSVPYVLRTFTSRMSWGKSDVKCHFIGECYLDGCMDGEATEPYTNRLGSTQLAQNRFIFI